jgi:hypothetical protein
VLDIAWYSIPRCERSDGEELAPDFPYMEWVCLVPGSGRPFSRRLKLSIPINILFAGHNFVHLHHVSLMPSLLQCHHIELF